jgi:hypothetical protein
MDAVVEKRPRWNVNHAVATRAIVEAPFQTGRLFVSGFEVAVHDTRLLRRNAKIDPTHLLAYLPFTSTLVHTHDI